LPVLWAESEQRPVQQIESEAHQAYFTLLGQHGYPAEPGRVLSCYSSSVSMEILARSLSASVDRVALVHPTFDNIADLLRGNGLDLVPVEEAARVLQDERRRTLVHLADPRASAALGELR
ncbi:hypothetical protein ADL27_47225, partial [Streptomyces sp. NRRL F-6602]